MADILGNLSKLSCSMHLPTLPSCSLQFLLSRPVCILGQPTGRWHLPQSWNKSQLDTRSHTARHGQAALRPEKAAINTLRKLNCFSPAHSFIYSHIKPLCFSLHPSYRQTSSLGRVSHAAHVEHRSEETQSTVISAVYLEAFKQLLRIQRTLKILNSL